MAAISPSLNAVEQKCLGQSIPPDTPHAVSVSLPTWRCNIGYEEGERWVKSRMTTGYPRFFIHKSIAAFADTIAKKHGLSGDHAMLFPCHAIGARCRQFLIRYKDAAVTDNSIRVVDFEAMPGNRTSEVGNVLRLTAVLFPSSLAGLAKSFWQHTGEGISSRRAEYLRRLYDEGFLVKHEKLEDLASSSKGPRRYQRALSRESVGMNGTGDSHEEEGRTKFIEERFGRNLNLQLASEAKTAIRRRIAGSLVTDGELEGALAEPPIGSSGRQKDGLSEQDVYLYPGGMNSIYNTHRSLLAARGDIKSICFGFPYIDTLKLLEKFGPGCLFYGNGLSEDLDDLERRLEFGERYLALFCEFPSNPLLRSPDLRRIRSLADRYEFAIVIDETIGNFLNVHTLSYADVLVSSLTKIFSGDSNVMGGSAILNPNGRYYSLMKQTWHAEYQDNYWPEDAVYMERNSRDFVSRIDRINSNAEAICDLLHEHPRIKQVYYPKVNPSRPDYEACRMPNGGYGGLLSATFFTDEDAATFYDNLDTAKGPSLGTNFTLSSPFVILAHYTELPWAAQFGVEANLVRFSVGLESTEKLLNDFQVALKAIER